jgi:hypothetical protein
VVGFFARAHCVQLTADQRIGNVAARLSIEAQLIETKS